VGTFEEDGSEVKVKRIAEGTEKRNLIDLARRFEGSVKGCNRAERIKKGGGVP